MRKFTFYTFCIGIFRLLADFMHDNEALDGKYYLWVNLVVLVVMYICLAMVGFSLFKIERFDVEVDLKTVRTEN